MTLLDYYIEKQQYTDWYYKFQSVSSDKSGKTFNYMNTNFRNILSFESQFSSFLSNIGVDRTEWTNIQRNGQEKDKHRVIGLSNANLIFKKDNKYELTAQGLCFLDIMNIDKNIYKKEIWLLIFLLILNHHDETNKNDFFKTTKKILSALEKEILITDFLDDVKKTMVLNSKRQLMQSDCFWLIVFYKDSEFINTFINSPIEEKNCLKDYVIKQSYTSNTNDCIGKKYVAGGVYTVSSFVDDLKIIYFTSYILTKNYDSYDTFIREVVDEYCNIFTFIDKKIINKFVTSHKSVYKLVFDDII